MDTPSRSQPARSKAKSKVETGMRKRKREEISDHDTDGHEELSASESTPEESPVPPRTTSGSLSRGLSATELQAELAQLGMDTRGTKFNEALAILQEWQVCFFLL